MVYCFDCDGVICEDLLKDTEWGKECSQWDTMRWIRYYREAIPNEEMIAKIQELKKKGYIIIIYTAREYIYSGVTQEWLHRHSIPYNQIRFDKPRASVYIDDRAFNYQKGDDIKKLFEKVREYEY